MLAVHTKPVPFLEFLDLDPVSTQLIYFTLFLPFLAWIIAVIFLQDSAQASHPEDIFISFNKYPLVTYYILVNVQGIEGPV